MNDAEFSYLQLCIFSQLPLPTQYVYIFICTVVLKWRVRSITRALTRYEDYPIKGPEAISHDVSPRASFLTSWLRTEKAVLHFPDFIVPAVCGTMKRRY